MKKILLLLLCSTVGVMSASVGHLPSEVPKVERFDDLKIQKVEIAVAEPMQFVISDMTLPDVVLVATSTETSTMPAMIEKAGTSNPVVTFKADDLHRRPRDGVRCNLGKS